MEWAINDAKRRREVVKGYITSATDMLGEYLNENFGSILCVDNLKVNPITGTHVFRSPNGRLAARFERDTNAVYLPKKEFKEYCVKRQGDLDDALNAPNPDYEFLGARKKRMASGSGIVAPAIECFEFIIRGELLESLREAETAEETDA
jgi:hypothetical protein